MLHLRLQESYNMFRGIFSRLSLNSSNWQLLRQGMLWFLIPDRRITDQPRGKQKDDS